MKEIYILGQRFLAKDYFCASDDEDYLCNPDSKFWLYINLTDRCPAACPFCVARDAMNCSGHISLEKMKTALYRIHPILSGVSITGGEPLTEPACLLEAAEIVHEVAGPDVELDLATNGYHISSLNPEMFNHFTTIHISRHAVSDVDQNRIMGWKAPSIQELKDWIGKLQDPGLIVFNCVLQKGGVENEQDVRDYMEMAANAGVQNVSFISMFDAGQYCRDYYVSPSLLRDISDKDKFRIWNAFHDHEFCSCSSGDYQTAKGWTRFYFRCPGKQKTPALRQLVFTADNILQDGFGPGRRKIDYD